MLAMYRPASSLLLAYLVLLLFPGMTFAQKWPPTPAKLMTVWSAKVDAQAPLPEYPRPQLVRTEWASLNGPWQYAVTAPNLGKPPGKTDGTILVPYPYQSALSGVMKLFDPANRLWYHRTVVVPPKWAGQRILLHFGAVSWQAVVYINGVRVAMHRGDYDAFTVEVPDSAKAGAFQLDLEVTDPMDTGGQARGKQVRASFGIYYTASTGIWRSVWMEPVAQAYIDHLVMRPDIDKGELDLTVAGTGTDPFDRIEAIASFGGKEVGRVEGPVGSEMSVPVPNPHLWDFSDPYLYDLKVTLFHGVGKSDEVTSYFGMRKVSVGKDAAGILRPMLNNKFYFQIGVLDQGFWPDGLYTAPTDEARRYDILMTKKYGFNVSRKHVKVEPDRWYYWCDKLGLLVWQDMPSADLGGDNRLDDEQAAQFRKELTAMVSGLSNHPCIVQWEIFNEAWGQHDTAPLTAMVQAQDPTRLVDSVSGFNLMPAGQVTDKHDYPGPSSPNPDDSHIAALGEFGGITTAYPGHLWVDATKTVGYNPIGDPSLITTGYPTLLRGVWALVAKPGLSAAIYTQLTDVEQESNGLMTYDRIPKMDPFVMRSANRVPDGTPGAFIQGDAPQITGTVPSAGTAGAAGTTGN
jgi:hypothetical protein